MTKEKNLENINVLSQEILPTPEELSNEIPLTQKGRDTVFGGRQAIQDILDGKDKRLMAVVGPCSIHDIDSAIEYAKRLQNNTDVLLPFNPVEEPYFFFN